MVKLLRESAKVYEGFLRSPSPITSTTQVSRRLRGHPKLSPEDGQSTEFPKTLLPRSWVNRDKGKSRRDPYSSSSSSGPRSPSTYRACLTALSVRWFSSSAPSSCRYSTAAAYQRPTGLIPMRSATACGATGVPGLSGSPGLCSSCNSFTPRRICSASRLVRSSVMFGTPASPILLGQLQGAALRTPPQLLQCCLRVRPTPPVPSSEQSQIAQALCLGVFIDDLRVVCAQDAPRRRRLHTTASLALDPRDQAAGGAQGVLLARCGLKPRRLAVEWAYQRVGWWRYRWLSTVRCCTRPPSLMGSIALRVLH